jgi:hypothetical protein
LFVIGDHTMSNPGRKFGGFAPPDAAIKAQQAKEKERRREQNRQVPIPPVEAAETESVTPEKSLKEK